MLALHSPQAVFSMRHAPSWLMLAFSAGAVNAIAFLACSRFVTHVTGTVTWVGLDANTVTLALDYSVVLAFFIAGATMSAVLIDGRHHRGLRPRYATPLVTVAAILVALAVAGMVGVFGTFGGSVEGPRDFAFLSVLAFAMGLQNAAVATSTGAIVRTTHMTGPATDLGVHMATALFAEGDARRNALRHAALRAGKILAFTVGAGAGGVLARNYHFASFLLPAALVLGATAFSFVSSSRPVETAPPKAA